MAMLTVPKDWTLVADIDESEPYEVDVTEIYEHEGRFILVTASGCSCWDGDYETQEFDSLEAIANVLLDSVRDSYTYNPSISGMKELMAQAQKWAEAR